MGKASKARRHEALKERRRVRQNEEYKDFHSAYTVLALDPRIRSVQKGSKGTLTFSTNWIIGEVEGVQIEIGRFQVSINPRMKTPDVTWLEYAIAKDASRQYPFYVIGGAGFCLGSGERFRFIVRLMQAREYLACAYTILESLAHINETDREQAAGIYRRVPQVHEVSPEEKRSAPWWKRRLPSLQ